MKILDFGSCNVDYVYSLDHIVAEGETETTERLEIFPGGKGLNQSIALAKAGAKVYFAGCIGCDSDILTEILTENGVDISLIKRTEQRNGHAVIQVSREGENSIFLYPGSNQLVTKEYIDSVLEHFDCGDYVLLQNEISNVEYIVEKAYEKQMRVILNPSPFNERINRIDLQKLSYIILNEVEMKALSGCETPEAGLSYLRKTYPDLGIILTLGENGCMYSDAKQQIFHPAYSVEVVDTTAAGDTFTGYFMAELTRTNDFGRILKMASAASAITVSGKGAAPSIPAYDTVLSSLAGMKKNGKDGKSALLRRQIETYITQNLPTAKLEELAEVMGYSPVYTGKLTKKLFGKSFSKVVQEERCRFAAEKLLHSDAYVEEIMKEVGYENGSFFRRIFKEIYGKNPLEYRKERTYP